MEDKVISEFKVIETEDGYRIEIKGNKEQLKRIFEHRGMPFGPGMGFGPGMHFRGRRGFGPFGWWFRRGWWGHQHPGWQGHEEEPTSRV